MYFNKSFFAVVAIFGCCIVNGLEIRPTVKPNLVLGSTTTKPVLEDKNLPPLAPPVTILEQYERRYPDGSYEWRYLLSDGTIRYEQGFIAHINDADVIIVSGHISYRLPDNRYLTVYYRADQNGYREESIIYSDVQPALPQIPAVRVDAVPTGGPKTSTTKKKLNI